MSSPLFTKPNELIQFVDTNQVPFTSSTFLGRVVAVGRVKFSKLNFLVDQYDFFVLNFSTRFLIYTPRFVLALINLDSF